MISIFKKGRIQVKMRRFQVFLCESWLYDVYCYVKWTFVMPIVRPIKRYFDPPHLLRKYLFETISRRELKILKRSLKKRPESDLSEEAGFADIMRRIREGRVTLQELDHLKAMMDTSPSRLRIVYEQTSSRHFLEGLRQAALASDARERGFKQIEAHMQSKGLWKEDCSN